MVKKGRTAEEVLAGFKPIDDIFFINWQSKGDFMRNYYR